MSRYWWIIGALLLGALPGCALPPAAKNAAVPLPEPPSSEEMGDQGKFTAWYARVLSKQYPDAKITVTAPLTIHALRPQVMGGDDIDIYLDRFYKACSKQPDDRMRCHDLVSAYLPNVFPRDKDSAIARGSLVAIVRTKEYLDQANRMSKDLKPDDEIVARPFVGPLWIIYAYDNSQNSGMLTHRQLKTLNLNEDQLDVIARQNTKRLLGPMGENKAKILGNTIQVINQGNLYESSRLLLYEQWQEMAEMQDAPLLVSIPARNVLVYTIANRATAAASLRNLDFKIAQRVPFPISPVVLRWTSTGWVQEPIPR
jgi:hypothetical protein